MRPLGISAPKYFHLDGWNGWRLAYPEYPVPRDWGVVFGPDGLTLRAGELPNTELARPVHARARGLAFDAMGGAIAVRDDRRALCLAGARGTCEPGAPAVWGLPEFRKATLGQLAVDRRGRLFVALPRLGEIRVLRLSPAGEIGRIRTPKPTAIAVGRDDTLYVLDETDGPIHGDQRLARIVRIRKAGDAIAVSKSGIVAIVAAGKESVLIGPPNDLREFQLRRPALPAVAFALDADDVLYIGDARSGRVVKYQLRDGRLDAMAWSTEVRGWSALAWRGQTLHGLSNECRVEPIAFESNGFYVTSASVVLGPLDSGLPATEWHRITGLVDTPPTAGVTAEVLAADDCHAFVPEAQENDARWTRPRDLVLARKGRPAELVLEGARGRFAWVRLTLHGDGRTAPRLNWLRVEYPRDSYLRYLPAIYSEDPDGRDLTARFLSLFEAENVDIGANISLLRRLFEPYAGDPEFFPWLAERIDLFLEPSWLPEKRRDVLAKALPLFRKRGTRTAMQTFLEWYGGPNIRIVEAFRARSSFVIGASGTNAVLGCSTILPGACEPPRMQLGRGLALGAARVDGRPFPELDPIAESRGMLTIFVPPALAAHGEILERIERIARQEAPAGAEVRFVAVRPRFSLGQTGRLNLDAALGRNLPWTLPAEPAPDTAPAAPPVAMLLAREPASGAAIQLGTGLRLGMDSTL
ncbi:phage tail protein [Pendulispora brunnea]|uniref:Phage tail protein n=1 Tax=Pendulispora brunnea TaxID=2905690 RepID=A0ABZ2KQK0_9BACT